ncbi:hypothetical protein, partial [Flavobacterium sp.]|uniref:hypothetical protein n=1 Tax=Flavobacterium sp. TaxID=239 RepID=UPI0026376946
GIPYYCGCTSGNAGCVNVLYVSCSGGGGGNSGDGVGNSGEGSGLGGEGGGGSTIGTDGDPLHPFVPNVLEFVENEPCDKLKDLLNTSKTNLKPWINNLKPKLNLVGEHGVIFRKNDLNQYGATYVPYDPELNDNEIFLKVGGDIYCAVHTHPSYTQPMFSWSDVLHLYNIQKNIKTHNSGLATFLVLCKDDFGVEQLYSISVNNISQFMNKIESIINSEEYLGCDITDVQKILDEKIERRFNLENNYERQFLKMFQSFNMTVAKANSQLTSWSVLSVNPLSPSIIAETPCN